MTTRVRMLLLACTGAAGLMLASSALAAFTPTIAIRHAPPTINSNGATSIRVAVPRDDDPLFRAVIYAPTGYTAVLAQPARHQLAVGQRDLPGNMQQAVGFHRCDIGGDGCGGGGQGDAQFTQPGFDAHEDAPWVDGIF